MVQQDQLVKKIQTLPSPLLNLVDTFVDFLLTRYRQPVNGKHQQQDDLDAIALTQVAISGNAFDWLADPAEDGIYTDADGEPV